MAVVPPLSPAAARSRDVAQALPALQAAVARLVDESRLRVALTEDLLVARRSGQPAPPAFSP